MSKLFCGSVDIVREPQLAGSDHPLAPLVGFYLTNSYEMAKRLAERKAKEQGAKSGCVNMYTFDDSTIFDMEMFCFDPSYETWRAIVDGDLLIGDVDLVRGPAIDETSHKQLFLFEGGVADVSMLKPEQVKKCEPVRQFLFCSERAAASLTFTGFEKFRLKE